MDHDRQRGFCLTMKSMENHGGLTPGSFRLAYSQGAIPGRLRLPACAAAGMSLQTRLIDIPFLPTFWEWLGFAVGLWDIAPAQYKQKLHLIDLQTVIPIRLRNQPFH